MPTGFTARVADGKVTTLRQFALLCARGMGATVDMRDEPLDAEIPHAFAPRIEWHQEQLAKAHATLAELATLTEDECQERAGFAHAAAMQQHEEREAARRLVQKRYDDMLTKVHEWTTEAEGIRKFMLEQLDMCIDPFAEPSPRQLNGASWRRDAEETALRDIAYHDKAIEDERHRVALANIWLAALRRSLPEE